MSSHLDHWLPFHREEPDHRQTLASISREILAPLVQLAGRIAQEPDLPAEQQHSLAETVGIIRESFARTESAFGVRSLEEALHGWEAALERFARTGGQTKLQTFGKLPDLSAASAGQLFLTVRECIANAIRHAEATRIEVLIAPWNHGCAVTVSDNGKGLTPDQGRGLGLSSMKRRILRCGGELLIHPSSGTLIEFRIPASMPGLWPWLLRSGQLDAGVSASRAGSLKQRWEERVERFGSMESFFRQWPSSAAGSVSPAPTTWEEIPHWLERNTAELGGSVACRHHLRRDRLTCHLHAPVTIDPLHWLETALSLERSFPTLLVCQDPHHLAFHVSPHAHHLPPPPPDQSFKLLLYEAWSGGMPGLRRDLASYLHDVLAQELFAESIRWELARDRLPPSPPREQCDRSSHELRRISLLTRKLSHELESL